MLGWGLLVIKMVMMMLVVMEMDSVGVFVVIIRVIETVVLAGGRGRSKWRYW